MRFKPINQINTILKQEYFEPTITWAFRVVLALNVPLIVLPLIVGFSYNIIWAAFGAYMLALLDYRGAHYKKITIQCIETVLIVSAALLGMYSSASLIAAILAMFFVGMFAALIRNWSDYGSSIGVAVGFFFLFGLANPAAGDQALQTCLYLVLGAGWSILITIISFPIRPSNPVRRSVAKVWKANTDFLDTLIEQQISFKGINAAQILQKEFAVREAINHSINLFARRQTEKTRLKAQHYDMMMELRKTASLFGAALSSMHEELEVLNSKPFESIRKSVLYKTLSAFNQASARMSVLMFTLEIEDLTLAKIRIKRCNIAIELLKEACLELNLTEKERQALQHFIETLEKAQGYLQQTIIQIEEKLQFKKSDYLENYKLSFNNFLSGLKPQALMEFLRELTNINSQQFKYALRVALGLSIGVFVFKFFNINHGYWIPLTMIIVIQPYYGATRKKSIERIVGTVAGIVLGGVIMLLPLPHEIFVCLLVVVSFFVAYFLRNNYKIGVFFVTIMMVILMQLSQQGSWNLIGWRILSTLIGAALAIIAGYVFWPIWEKQRFPFLIKNSFQQNKLYLEQVINYFNKELPLNESWHKHRRLAEAANSNVFACVQRMYEEPEHIQTMVNHNFAMVGVNIRIAREITSIALIVNEINQTKPLTELNLFYNKAAEIFDWMSEKTSLPFTAINLPEFKSIKESLQSVAYEENDQLMFMKTELEKIIFELETLCLLIQQRETKLTKELI
jgi:uncharacterized membrane protein YccC